MFIRVTEECQRIEDELQHKLHIQHLIYAFTRERACAGIHMDRE